MILKKFSNYMLFITLPEIVKLSVKNNQTNCPFITILKRSARQRPRLHF